MENDADSAITCVNRAISYMGQGDYDLAISEYTRAIQLDSSLYIAYVNRASAGRLNRRNIR